MPHDPTEIDEEPTDPIGPGDLFNAIARSHGVSIDTPPPAVSRDVAPEAPPDGTLAPVPRRAPMAISVPQRSSWGSWALRAGVALLVVGLYAWVFLGG